MPVFDEAAVTTVSLTDLVGEGKKFKTVEDLAKSKVEADTFIETLKAERLAEKEEVARLRAELLTAKSVEEQIKALSATKEKPIPNAQTELPVTAPNLSEAIRAELESQNRNRTLSQNVQTVTDKLIEVYGSEQKANEVVKAKATELGVSTKFLLDTAAASPNAFYNTIGLDAKSVSPGVTKSDVNTESFRKLTPVTEGTYEHFRNTNAGNDVKKLLDPAYLKSSMDAALKNPDKFFANAS